VNTAVLNAVSQQDQSAALQMFLDEVQSAARQFTAFLEGAIIVLLEKALKSTLASQGKTENIVLRKSFDEIAIPYFYDHGLLDED